jgi:hypothetical protein
MDRVAAQGPMVFVLLLLVDRVVPGRGLIWGILGPIYDLLLKIILTAGA